VTAHDDDLDELAWIRRRFRESGAARGQTDQERRDRNQTSCRHGASPPLDQ
jgi:hypothetical protein